MKENILKSKSLVFAISVVELTKALASDKREFVLSKQLLRSGTSIGAMVREAEHAQSKADFIHKLSIAQKEANETLYWLELLSATDYISKTDFTTHFQSAGELLKMITSSIKTAKSNLK
ncbi:MAG: four helix bundle protein [Cyclobacteriaceae bacterium]|nr:four helix bundle protein [Cyclobacteriaceae bacterium]